MFPPQAAKQTISVTTTRRQNYQPHEQKLHHETSSPRYPGSSATTRQLECWMWARTTSTTTATMPLTNDDPTATVTTTHAGGRCAGTSTRAGNSNSDNSNQNICVWGSAPVTYEFVVTSKTYIQCSAAFPTPYLHCASTR